MFTRTGSKQIKMDQVQKLNRISLLFTVYKRPFYGSKNWLAFLQVQFWIQSFGSVPDRFEDDPM